MATPLIDTKESKMSDKNITGPGQRCALDGLYLHTFKDGDICYQGRIVACDGDTALVELFSWITGEATHIEPMAKAFIYSAACKLYASAEQMNDAAEKAPRIHGGTP